MSLLPLRTTTLLAALLLVVAPAAHAQDGTIIGLVSDAEEGNPLVGATAYIAELARGAATDRNGRLEISGVPAGTHTVEVRFIGSVTQQMDVTVQAGQTTQFEVILAPDGVMLDGVTVSSSPITGSQAAALSRMRASPTVVNVVASDLVGKFPDQNAAAALSRGPGIAVQRDQGQARYINLRGAPQRWTTLAFDDVNVIGSEGRIVRFDEIPAPVIQSIEVVKAVTPDLPAESVAGRINVTTASAFDRPGFHVSAEAAPGVFELGGGLQYNAFARVSNTWGNRVGFTATATRYSRNQVTDNIESDYEPSASGALFPTNADFRVYYLERTNNAYSGRFDFRPTDNHQLFVTSTFVEFNDDEERNQYIFDFDGAAAGFMADGNTPERGDLTAVPMQQLLGPGAYRNSTWTTIAGGSSRLGNWTADYRASYTQTNAELDLPLFFLVEASPGISLGYDFTNVDQPSIGLTDLEGNALSGISQDSPESALAFLIDSDEEADAYSGQLDLSRGWTLLGTPSTLKVGGKVDLRDKTGYQFATNLVPVGPLLDAIGADPINFGAFVMDDELAGDFPFGSQYDVRRVDVNALGDELRRRVDQLQEADLYDPSTAVPDESRFDVREAIVAGYAMNTWQTRWGSVLAGARVERVRYETAGFRVTEDGTEPAEADTDEFGVFPSVHVAIDLRDDLKLRLAGTSTVSRADFNARRPGAGIDDTNGFISGGNPEVRSERSWGLDARLEYYLPRTGIVSVAGFGKFVDDPLFTTTGLVGDGRFDGGGIDRSGYLFNAPGNGADGRVYGIELDYFQQWHFLPGPLAGLGLQLNGTLLTSEFSTSPTPDGTVREVAFPGTSDAVFNGSLFFERYGFSARLSYQWRDAWLDSIDPADDQFDTYWDSEERLDVSVRYALTPEFTLFADANNLTDELGRRYQSVASRPVEIEGFGRRYLLGLRVDF
ncbi:MAG: TonB-dependent receptor [Bacteroidota bacterium]